MIASPCVSRRSSVLCCPHVSWAMLCRSRRTLNTGSPPRTRRAALLSGCIASTFDSHALRGTLGLVAAVAFASFAAPFCMLARSTVYGVAANLPQMIDGDAASRLIGIARKSDTKGACHVAYAQLVHGIDRLRSGEVPEPALESRRRGVEGELEARARLHKITLLAAQLLH